jgi:hypothetical protein
MRSDTAITRRLVEAAPGPPALGRGATVQSHPAQTDILQGGWGVLCLGAVSYFDHWFNTRNRSQFVWGISTCANVLGDVIRCAVLSLPQPSLFLTHALGELSLEWFRAASRLCCHSYHNRLSGENLDICCFDSGASLRSSRPLEAVPIYERGQRRRRRSRRKL